MNISEQERCSALYGLGRCAYETKQYEEAVQWLGQAIQLTTGKGDLRVGPACFLLGESYIALGQFGAAAGALRTALDNALDNGEYVKIMTDLVEAECRQENYLQAMNLLESVPEARLNQQEACRVLAMKARVYRDLDLADTAITLLQRRLELIVEAPLRAMLATELGHCYVVNEDYKAAKKELSAALYDLPAGLPQQRCRYLLAQSCFALGELAQAESHCIRAVENTIADDSLQAQVFGLLGRIYDSQALYEQAAMAYAGIAPKEAVQ
jgi:tetratricopeptide (TPR) repeat protein